MTKRQLVKWLEAKQSDAKAEVEIQYATAEKAYFAQRDEALKINETVDEVFRLISEADTVANRWKVYLDFSVECFSQIWGSTCTGFDVTEAGEPVMAGSAMTEEYTTIVHEKTTDTYCVFFGDRPCYKVDNPSNEFYEDMMKRQMASLSRAKNRY